MIQERRGRWERMGAGYVEEIVIQEELEEWPVGQC